MIKISANPQQRSEIMTICDIMGAKIIDLTHNTVTVEISDTSANLQRFEELIRPYGIKEIVRTGVIAIQKGSESLKK
jgi:acetolactate synthase-1/3 small subunit